MTVMDEMVCFSLYAASRATTQAYRELLDPFGLTYAQYLVLIVLWSEGPRTVRELGEALQLDSGTLSPMLRRMETAGHLERTRSTADERVVTITLTAKGSALRGELAHVPECILRGTGLAGASDARELIAALQALTRSLQENTASGAVLASAPSKETS